MCWWDVVYIELPADHLQWQTLVLVLLNIPGRTFAKMTFRETEGLRFCSFGHFMTLYQLQTFVYAQTFVCKSGSKWSITESYVYGAVHHLDS